MKERRKVDEAIGQTEADLNEILGRLSRLRRQRAALTERSAELFRRGMRGLEEEERQDSERLAVETQSAVGDAQLAGAVGILDWDAIGVGFPLSDDSNALDWSQWEPPEAEVPRSPAAPEVPVAQGSSGGTPRVPPCNLPNS